MKELLFKGETVHPSKEEITKYIWHELDEEKEIAIGEHMAVCEECVNQAQEEARFQFLWENWQAESHGEIHWHKYVWQVMQRSYQSTQSFLLKHRLKGWINDWKGKLGSIIQFLEQKKDKLVEITSNFPGDIFAQGNQYQFATAAPVRGSETAADKIIKMQTREDPRIQVYFDEVKMSMLIKIPKGEFDPPLVIMAPRLGVPQTAYPESVEGTNFFTVSFTNIPPGGFMLLFEPIKQTEKPW